MDAFTEKLAGISPAHENFINMPLSVRRTYTGRHLSFKTEEARKRDFEKISEPLAKQGGITFDFAVMVVKSLRGERHPIHKRTDLIPEIFNHFYFFSGYIRNITKRGV